MAGEAPTRSSDTAGGAQRPPGISLPKGGGAISGIGEKFSANAATGTGSMTVPIATTPGRDNFGPQLTVTYDSGNGNGAFGFGWALSLPAITRKTDKGLPRYADNEDSDVFVLSGAEDLVPTYRQAADGSWLRDASGRFIPYVDEVDGYRVRRYRPRVEGLFARIERWSRIGTPGDVHWRSISKENVLTVFGVDENGRVADPLAPDRIFSWLISEVRDDKGNAVLYTYKAEDGAGVDLSAPHQRNRGPLNDPRRTANRYIKRIVYGNRTPLLDANGLRPRFLDRAHIEVDIRNAGWMFEVQFDYGEHDPAAPSPEDAGEWSLRADACSSYRPGFEVRTSRLCRRVLMFHHFPDAAPEVGTKCLTRSTDFTYAADVDPSDASKPVYAFLHQIGAVSYRRNGAGYDRAALPPLEFQYSQAAIDETVRTVDAESVENLPAGMGGRDYRWVDLDGEGVPGVLSAQGGAWFYKRNLSPIAETGAAAFAPVETVATMPNLASSADADFRDLAGDGAPHVVLVNGPVEGSYRHRELEGWGNFRPFRSQLNRDWHDPNARFIDLDGDGLADLLILDDEVLLWHRSLGEDGFEPARRVARAFDEERGPRIVFADAAESIYTADLSGDGLSDLVRVRNGEVCYWPNLGWGRFGAKVTMDNSPWFDYPDGFDQTRIRLADIDGTGTADLIYLHPDGVRLYFNQAGNGWSRPTVLSVAPRVDDLKDIQAVDLLGNGSACLVWSSPLPADARQPMRYVNLIGSGKPHLLTRLANNLGAETRIEYAPSTKFYLLDKLAGRPWISRLAFPVHVVERVEVHDRVSRNGFVTRYAYHHGHYDGVEREFRGFGMVEQWDTEEFGEGSGAFDVPPARTRTWFHTGVFLGARRVARQFEHEYFREPGLTIDRARPLLLDDTVLPDGLDPGAQREACRALKGALLRQEIYADDAGADATAEQKRRAAIPYLVKEQNFTVCAVQPHGENLHGVFYTHARELIEYNYERNPSDPRIKHDLTLEVDGYGNVLKEAAAGYSRRAGPALAALLGADRVKQTTPLVTYTETRFTPVTDSGDAYRVPQQYEQHVFELTGYAATGPAGRLQMSDLVEPDPAQPGRLRHKFAHDLAYHETPSEAWSRRTVRRNRTVFRRDDLSGPLTLGSSDRMAIVFERYDLVFTQGLLDLAMQRPREGQAPEPLLPNPAAVLTGQAGDRGGYLQAQSLQADGIFPADDVHTDWWAPTGRAFFSADAADDAHAELANARQHFFLAVRFRDPFAQDTLVTYDPNDLLPVQTRDPAGNVTAVEACDYRVLRPRLMSDPNGNRTEVAFNILGLVAGKAAMGKPLPAPVEGDSLTGFVTEITEAERASIFDAADPRPAAAALVKDAGARYAYDVDRFRRTRLANPDDPSKWEPICAAVLTRETHANAPPPPGELKIRMEYGYSDGFGRQIQTKSPAEPEAEVDPRWVGSGWVIFNNKGKPVRQYEPFFSATQTFEFGAAVGVSPVLFYDPTDRVVATLYANDTYDKVVFDPWQRRTFDTNDTSAPHPGSAAGPGRQTGDPRTDPDIAGYVAGYFASLPANPPWQTWYARRIGGALGPLERTAAQRSANAANTPTTEHFDVLGRSFLTEARNRVVCAGHDLDGTEESLPSRVTLDIDGNQLEIRDADQQSGDPLGRVIARSTYDLRGNRLYELSMEGGARWRLNDVAGKLLRAWDSRGHNFVSIYDSVRRLVGQTVRGTTADSDTRTLDRDLLVDKVVYGETLPGAERWNLRRQVYRQFDVSGLLTSARLDENGAPVEAFDFKGNLLASTRQLLADYKAIPDWQQTPALEAEAFVTATRYDALNRPAQTIAPHSTGAAKRHVIQPVFNRANLLERVDVWLERDGEPTGLIDPAVEAPSQAGVADIDYDAKGQRVRIDYRNGASTTYEYDIETFRLTRLYTARGAAFDGDCDNPIPPATLAAPGTPPAGVSCGVQNLGYTYDAAGNLTHVRDVAQQAVYFRNRRVEPSNDYVYDALNRLVQASGREHLGQLASSDRRPPTAPDAFDAFHTKLDHPANGDAMGTYVERYVYDAAGNFRQIQHRGADPASPGWTRVFQYSEASLTENGHDGLPVKTSNRLTRSTVNPAGGDPTLETFSYDPHGSITRFAHLGDGGPGPNVAWDFKDRLLRADLGGGGTAVYVYDAGGQRVRKVWEKTPGLTEERIYLGNFEIHRTHPGTIAAAPDLERQTLHVVDDKRRIVMVEIRTTGDDPAPRRLVRYQVLNHLGSATLELDESAQIISYEEFSPYGNTTYQAVRSQTDLPKRYRYTGKERDEETGLCYHGARYYAPWLGRWSSADPKGLIDGPNLYRYARDNPLMFTDTGGNYAGDPQDAQTVAFAAAALQQAARILAGTGAAGGTAAATTTTVVTGGGTVVAGEAGGSLALAGGALVAAQIVAAGAMALAVRNYMQRSANIVRTGNPWGLTHDDLWPVLREARKLRTDPFPDPGPEPQPKPKEDEDEKKRPRPGRIYVTYTKYNSKTGRYYSGRTSAVIDLNKPWAPQAEAAVRARDANHHIDEDDEPKDPAFGPAQVDKYAVGFAVDYGERYRDVGYLAIRGREQQLIDYYGAKKAGDLGIKNFKGGAKSDTDPGQQLTENNVRGVAKDNVLGEVFHAASNLKFGPLAAFTGDKVLQRQPAGAR
jgi:RHS repeat-associated protein